MAEDARTALQSRLVAVWPWLPAFRAVAEIEHVQRAALGLHVTPSSLSRAIRLLEDHLGRRVFDRVGRNIRLNHDGRELLAAVRDGMRRIDDSIALVTETLYAGELSIACEGDQPLGYAWQAAAALRAKHPALALSIVRAPAARERARALLRGTFDVALVSQAASDARLIVERVGEVTYGIYCGATHALARVPHPTAEQICGHPFVGPTSAGEDSLPDQWPDDRPRIVALRLPALTPAIAACAGGAYLAVLPDEAAATASGPPLVRLAALAIAPGALFAVRRRPTGAIDRAGAFVAEIRDVLAARVTRATARRGPPRPAAGPAPSRPASARRRTRSG